MAGHQAMMGTAQKANTKNLSDYLFHSLREPVWLTSLTKGKIMGKRVFANFYFEVKFGQGVKATKYLEEIKAEALKLGISDVHMGRVEIGNNATYIYFSLIFESADAYGRQWGSGSEMEAKGADWKALWSRVSQEPSQIFERKGADLIYEQ